MAANDIMEISIMLVLSRKVGESILISESIRVTVVQSANGRIRLGIDAPPEVKVLREELTRSCSVSSRDDIEGEQVQVLREELARSCFHSPPSKNGKAKALSPSAQLL